MCKLCGKAYKSKKALNYHMKAKHNIGKNVPKVNCPKCQKSYINKAGLIYHMNKHSIEANPKN